MYIQTYIKLHFQNSPPTKCSPNLFLTFFFLNNGKYF